MRGSLDSADDGLGRRGRAGKGGWHIEDKHGIICLIGQQCFERVRVACRISVTDDVDRVSARPRRRQKSVQCHKTVRNPGECPPEVDQSIDRKHADAAAVSEDGEASPSKRSLAAERFGRCEGLVEVEHAQQACAPKHSIVDRVRPGECARMGRSRLAPCSNTQPNQ